MTCRQRLWQDLRAQVELELRDPEAAARQQAARNRSTARPLTGRSADPYAERERERNKTNARTGGEITDLAYQREYLDHDRKRIKRT